MFFSCCAYEWKLTFFVVLAERLLFEVFVFRVACPPGRERMKRAAVAFRNKPLGYSTVYSLHEVRVPWPRAFAAHGVTLVTQPVGSVVLIFRRGCCLRPHLGTGAFFFFFLRCRRGAR